MITNEAAAALVEVGYGYLNGLRLAAGEEPANVEREPSRRSSRRG